MHRRPRLSSYGRQLIIERLASGRRAPVVAEELGVSRATVYKWWRRYRQEGWPGLEDRSSRPHHSPHRLSTAAEARILELRRQRKLGPHRLAPLTGHPRSTCYAVLRRHDLHRLDWLDRPTGNSIRRYEAERPGQLGHLDVKKLGRIPPGGGHRLLMTRKRYGSERRRRKFGYDYVHSLVDDHSRLAYSEVLPDERGFTCGAFLLRAGQFFARHGIRFERLMSDNAFSYRRSPFVLLAVKVLGCRQSFIPPYRPQVNGKVERFNRTLLDEWAYVRLYKDNSERTQLLPDWLHLYNFHRTHTSLGGLPPASRLNNVDGNYS